MQQDARDFLRRSYASNIALDRCNIFRQLYAEKYPGFKWHVAMYYAYSIEGLKSIELRVNNNNIIESYILFATGQ